MNSQPPTTLMVRNVVKTLREYIRVRPKLSGRLLSMPRLIKLHDLVNQRLKKMETFKIISESIQ